MATTLSSSAAECKLAPVAMGSGPSSSPILADYDKWLASTGTVEQSLHSGLGSHATLDEHDTHSASPTLSPAPTSNGKGQALSHLDTDSEAESASSEEANGNSASLEDAPLTTDQIRTLIRLQVLRLKVDSLQSKAQQVETAQASLEARIRELEKPVEGVPTLAELVEMAQDLKETIMARIEAANASPAQTDDESDEEGSDEAELESEDEDLPQQATSHKRALSAESSSSSSYGADDEAEAGPSTAKRVKLA